MVLTKDRRFLLVTNVGSDQVSVFRVHGAGLDLVAVQASGGSGPDSIAVDGTLVYVLNKGGAGVGNISGFRLGREGARIRASLRGVEPLRDDALTANVRTVVAGETVFLVREVAGEPAGAAPAVLLLHGVPETSSCWRDLAPRLAQGRSGGRVGARRVLAPDLPGLGGSGYQGPYDVASVVAQVAALLDAETGRVDVVGHDWGGVVALGLAGLRPDLVRRLVVVNAPYRTGPPVHRAPYLPVLALPLLPDLALAVAGRRLVDLALRAGWRSPVALDAERRAEYQAAYTGRDHRSAVLGYYRAAVRPRAGAPLPGTALARGLPGVHAERALVLWGALDPVLPISTGEAACRDLGPGTPMTTIPGAGHFVLEEAPDVVADVLLDALG